jgi:putative oxidoreductase
MLVAIFAVHADKGLFVANNGFEFGLALLAIAVSLVVTGAGRASVDQALARNLVAR